MYNSGSNYGTINGVDLKDPANLNPPTNIMLGLIIFVILVSMGMPPIHVTIALVFREIP
jgi:hypothetical protein